MNKRNGHGLMEDIVSESGRTWNQWHQEIESDKFVGLDKHQVEERLVDEYSIERGWAKRISNRCTDGPSAKSGYEISLRKTFDYPLDCIMSNATDWFEGERRALDLGIEDSSQLRCRWLTDDSDVCVQLHSKANGKTQLVLRHQRLQSRSDAEIMRNFWKESLSGMIEAL